MNEAQRLATKEMREMQEQDSNTKNNKRKRKRNDTLDDGVGSDMPAS